MTHVLIIDNYDSFTHNLAQLLHGLAEEIRVVRNDQIDLATLADARPAHIILSPGPGTPEKPRDFGVCGDIVAAARDGQLDIPVLGVCLGHQGLAYGFGARVVRSGEVMHGKTSPVRHTGTRIFEGVESPLEAMRYHSLVVEPSSLPDVFETLAHTENGVLMAIAHRTLPLFGVQFHPESIGTPEGRRLMANFIAVKGGVG